MTNTIAAKPIPIKFMTRKQEGIIVPEQLSVSEIMIYLKTTETCQLNCSHCFTNGTNGRKIYFDPNQTIDWFHRFHEAMPNVTAGSVAFHGGEPFLAPVADMRKVWMETKDLWDNVWWSTTTNLVYTMDDDKRDFFKECFTHGVATSWDRDIRFANKKQEQLWASNLKLLQDDGHDITLMISLSKSITDRPAEELLRFVMDLGIQYLHLERITANGNAVANSSIMPSNEELDRWFVDLWDASVKLNAHKYFANLFTNSILSSLVTSTHSGCRCRSCEKKVFTVNADGTIGGCANSAVETTFGHISDDIRQLLTAPGRIQNIVCETQRNPLCFGCDVYDICNGDCHQLAWQGDVCASPKTLMQQLKRDNNNVLYREILGSFMGQE
jgi:radical SAM protein with 4Fe4S-binding SPASM domain